MSDRDEIMRALAAIAAQVERATGDLVVIRAALGLLYGQSALASAGDPLLALEARLAFLDAAIAQLAARDPTGPTHLTAREFMDHLRAAAEAVVADRRFAP